MLIASCALEPVHAAPPGSAVYAAASETHAWWIGEIAPSEHEPRAWVLFHRALLDEEPIIRRAWTFSRPPEAVAAMGREVWIAFAPQGDRAREVFQLATDRVSSSVYWVNTSIAPSPRPPLPALGVLRGLALTKDGAFACWSPTLREAPQLLHCDGDRWSAETVAIEGSAATALSLDDGIGLLGVAPSGSLLIGQSRGNHAGTGTSPSRSVILLEREVAGSDGATTRKWSTRMLAIPTKEAAHFDATPTLGSTIVEGRLVLGMGEPMGRVECFDVRGDALLPWTTIDLGTIASQGRAPSSFIAIGLQTGARIIAFEDTPEGKSLGARIASIDVSRGIIGPWTPLREGSPNAGQWIFSLFGLAAAALLVVTFFMRPAGRDGVQAIAPSRSVASFGQRLVALLIDLIPGAVASIVLFDLSLKEAGVLLITPSLAVDLEAVLPSCVMVGVSGGLVILVESITGASAGKWVMGICVVSDCGEPSSWKRRFLRAFLAFVVVLAPVLALATISHPRLRGVPELLTKTEVIRRSGNRSERPTGDADGR